MKLLSGKLHFLVLILSLLPPAVNAAGTWTPLANRPPGNAGHFLLLPDGTVMAEKLGAGGVGPGWYRLVPDSHGSYVNGTWTTNSANLDFTALTSTNVALPLADWTILGNAIQVTPGVYQFTDPGATNDPQRFYRVVSP